MPCVFCAAPGHLTTEDVIPVWARMALEATGRVYLRGPGGRFIKDTTGLTLKLRRAVCQPCNNGWMSQTERLVAPLLERPMRGELAAFAKPQTGLIAFWAVKTTLLMELANRVMREGMYAPESNLRWLYEHRDDRQPPPGAYVWIAAVDPQNPGGDGARYTVSFNKFGQVSHDDPDTGEDTLPSAYFATFTLGALVFHVFGQDFRPDGRTRGGQPLSRVGPPDDVDRFLVRLWPDEEPVVVWPPAQALSTDDIVAFAEWPARLDRYVVGQGRHRRIILTDTDDHARFR